MQPVFVDTWAWLALALRRDQHHELAKRQHAEFNTLGRTYITSDDVLTELITQLYRSTSPDNAQSFIRAIFAAIEVGDFRLEKISARRFDAAWQLRQHYSDKPKISFVDFSSCVVMRELGINDIFTGDVHFAQVNMGFRLLPAKRR